MTEARLMSIAEEANVIVNGYALTLREDGFISILNLYHPDYYRLSIQLVLLK